MTVAELRQTSPERFEITFSDGSAMKTSLSVVADFSLYAGRELTEKEYGGVAAASRLALAKDRALRIIGSRPMSERELYDRLVEKGETQETAAECVEYLLKLRLLDDAEYASLLVRHYAAKGYGSRRVRDELYRHKVPKDLWDAAMENMPRQDDTVDRLLRSRLKSAEPDREELRKASAALLRRGYGWDEIKAAVARYDSSFEEED